MYKSKERGSLNAITIGENEVQHSETFHGLTFWQMGGALKDGEDFAIFARINGHENAGYIAGTLLPSKKICFVEALYIDHKEFRGLGLSHVLLRKAFQLGEFQYVCAVDVESNRPYWNATMKKNVVPLALPITNSIMRRMLYAADRGGYQANDNLPKYQANGHTSL